jgi:hypothetical protein
MTESIIVVKLFTIFLFNNLYPDFRDRYNCLGASNILFANSDAILSFKNKFLSLAYSN